MVGVVGTKEKAYLSRNADFIQLLESDGSFGFICIIENDSNGSSRHACLSPLVDQIQQILRSNLEARFVLILVKLTELVDLKARWIGLTVVRLVIPRTKQIASRMFDFPEPFLNSPSRLEQSP